MIRDLISIYRPSYPGSLVYMLQSTEYQIGPYLKWVNRTKDFSTVMQRRELATTKAARLLLWAVRLGILLQIFGGVILIYLGRRHSLAGGEAFGAAIILSYPFLWAYLLVVPLLVGCWLISGPEVARLLQESEQVFAKHSAIKIAIAGSYGKTTMKELLATILGEGLKVAATPANKNVSISHARFAANLKGNEDVLILEYGEGAPGDVKRFAKLTHPTHAVITGLAPAHLDRYKTVQAAGEDIFAVAEYVNSRQVYVNDESPSIKPFLKKQYELFDGKGALGWNIDRVKLDLSGTAFTLNKGQRSIKFRSGLIGRHQIGFLAFAAAFSLKLGLSEKQVVSGISKIVPVEHRMQPYKLGGAWIIDDTYNGNLEGIRAGTQLLKDLEAKRKIYVTPGLVDQGEENKRVHIEVGKLIANAQPDLLVLMQNSVTSYIEQGLMLGKFKGKTQIESNPLEFYTNLKHFVASGDLVVMQNDWTDNYN